MRNGGIDVSVESNLGDSVNIPFLQVDKGNAGTDLINHLYEFENNFEEQSLGKVELEYINRGSDALRGVTWTYIKRSPFAGEIIDGTNKKSIMYREATKYKEKNPNASKEECLEWGKRYVNKEQKHFKKYLKGENSYSYKKGKYLVEDQTRVEQFKKIAARMEEEQRLKELEKQNNIDVTEENSEIN